MAAMDSILEPVIHIGGWVRFPHHGHPGDPVKLSALLAADLLTVGVIEVAYKDHLSSR
jgi:hypothetical protein